MAKTKQTQRKVAASPSVAARKHKQQFRLAIFLARSGDINLVKMKQFTAEEQDWIKKADEEWLNDYESDEEDVECREEPLSQSEDWVLEQLSK